jgi:hypothetical protein
MPRRADDGAEPTVEPAETGRWRRLARRMQPRHALLLQRDALWDAGSSRRPNRPPAAHGGFADWCRRHPGDACDLWLSATMVHELVCDPALPPSTDASLISYARNVFVHYHGDAARAWPLAAWSSQGQQGVSALHGVDLTALQHEARAHAVRLHALRPWWSRALAQALRQAPGLRGAPQAWLLVVEGRHLCALRLHRGSLAELRTQWLAGAHAAALEPVLPQLCDAALPRLADAPVYALGHGLSGEPSPAIRCLGRLDEAAPAAHWLLPSGR